MLGIKRWAHYHSAPQKVVVLFWHLSAFRRFFPNGISSLKNIFIGKIVNSIIHRNIAI
jgi:hypothetical protein